METGSELNPLILHAPAFTPWIHQKCSQLAFSSQLYISNRKDVQDET